MTHNQARWASQHDWYVTSSHPEQATTPGLLTHGWTVHVLESGTQLLPDGTVVQYSERHQFDDYQALRAWAGY